jgi:hypothetical protein
LRCHAVVGLEHCFEVPCRCQVWYNVGHVAMASGDLPWAQQCLANAIASDPSHAEAHANAAVLHLRRASSTSASTSFTGAAEAAASSASTSTSAASAASAAAAASLHEAQRLAPHLYEPLYNRGKEAPPSTRRRLSSHGHANPTLSTIRSSTKYHL